ncbi:hypothetical protein Taro_023073 [Colocasia esculenta]|uniref:R3H domain-containing protein n=1 Tax=Colocasia esculenta TaxID=4460 RepID=A0A843V2Y2_COLES|nr:hypothetical protein [Colocasia esculenta]
MPRAAEAPSKATEAIPSVILVDVRHQSVYTFEPGLTKYERAAIHVMCRKMGMISKSSGFGDRRRLSVYKRKNKEAAKKKEEESTTVLKFSEQTKSVLHDLFMRYPPGEEELNEGTLNDSARNSGKRQVKKDKSFCKPSMSEEEIAKKLNSLAAKMEAAPQLRKVVEEKGKLPIAAFKDVITSTVESNQTATSLFSEAKVQERTMLRGGDVAEEIRQHKVNKTEWEEQVQRTRVQQMLQALANPNSSPTNL